MQRGKKRYQIYAAEDLRMAQLSPRKIEN